MTRKVKGEISQYEKSWRMEKIDFPKIAREWLYDIRGMFAQWEMRRTVQETRDSLIFMKQQ